MGKGKLKWNKAITREGCSFESAHPRWPPPLTPLALNGRWKRLILERQQQNRLHHCTACSSLLASDLCFVQSYRTWWHQSTRIRLIALLNCMGVRRLFSRLGQNFLEGPTGAYYLLYYNEKGTISKPNYSCPARRGQRPPLPSPPDSHLQLCLCFNTFS